MSKCKQFCVLRHKILPVITVMMLIPPPTGKAQTVTVTYNTPGNYTATVPCGAVNAMGQAKGGGGGGGGASVKGYHGIGYYVAAAAAGGGGQGCYITGTLRAGVPYNIVVGSGGIQNGSTLVQEAKQGGYSAVGLNIAIGGHGAPSIYTYSNGIGDEGGRITDGGTPGCTRVAGGASGSMSNAGWDSTAPTNVYGGTGGGSATNGGQCGSSNGAFPGQPGTDAGSGGGGSAARSNDDKDTKSAVGGTGANGRAIVTFDLSLSITGTNTYCKGDELRLSVIDPCGSAIYVWRQNSYQVGTGATLIIPDLMVVHSGNYTVETGISTGYPGSSVTGSNLPTGITINGTYLSGTLVSAEFAVTVSSFQTRPIYKTPNFSK